MEQAWTIGSIIEWTKEYFVGKKIADARDARLEAELLLSSVLDCPRLNLHVNRAEILPQEKLNNYKELILKRAKRMPLSYILGEHEFMGLKMAVNEHTLIPRNETEILVEEAIKIIENGKLRLGADLCTGSGCIAISLAKFSGLSKIFAADISSEALRTAYENSIKNNVLAKIVFKEGNLFDAFKGESLEGKLDIIISNPPYIADNEFAALQPEIEFEPRIALNGGKEGLDFYIKIVYDAVKYLKPDGYLMFEMNSAKSKEIETILAKGGFAVQKILKDYSKLDRVIIGKKNG